MLGTSFIFFRIYTQLPINFSCKQLSNRFFKYQYPGFFCPSWILIFILLFTAEFKILMFFFCFKACNMDIVDYFPKDQQKLTKEAWNTIRKVTKYMVEDHFIVVDVAPRTSIERMTGAFSLRFRRVVSWF